MNEPSSSAHVTLSPNPSPRERGWRQKPPFVASLLIAPPQAGRDVAEGEALLSHKYLVIICGILIIFGDSANYIYL